MYVLGSTNSDCFATPQIDFAPVARNSKTGFATKDAGGDNAKAPGQNADKQDRGKQKRTHHVEPSSPVAETMASTAANRLS